MALVIEVFKDGTTHAACHHAVFEGDNAVEALGHLVEQLRVEGFNKAHVVVGNADVGMLLFVGGDGFCRCVADGSQRKDGQMFSVLQTTAAAHRNLIEGAMWVCQAATATRIADNEHALVGQGGGVHKAAQFVLVVGRRYRQARHGAQGGDVEHAMMRCAVLSYDACAVKANHQVQSQKGSIVDDVVVGALGKRGIDIAERQQAFFGHSSGEGDGVALSNAHVESAVGHFPHEEIHRAARRHGWRDAYNIRILPSQFNQCVTKHVLIAHGRILAARTDTLTALHIEFSRRVPQGGFFLGGLVALSLRGMYVEYLRPFHILNFAQDAHQFYDVVAIRRPEVADVHALKYVLLVGQQRLETIVEPQYLPLAPLVKPSPFGKLAGDAKTQAVVPRTGVQMEQVLLHAAHAVVDAHIVVVKDDEQVVGRFAGIVESLKREAATHRAVANDGHHVAVALTMAYGSNAHTQGSRDGITGMAAGKGVVFTLSGRGEGPQTVQLAIGGEGIAPPRQHLVAVSLMSHVPHEQIARRIHNVVKSHGQFNGAEAGGKVSGVLRQFFYKVSAQLSAHCRQRLNGQRAQVGRRIYASEVLITIFVFHINIW